MVANVREFYKNKNVLLTGGTGFFGKMIIEKLIRTTEVNCIFLIVRPKQDVPFEKRVANMFKEEIFCRINQASETLSKKLRPIEGDLRKKGLGLSDDNRLFLQENINVVFHCGASLNMDAKLYDSVMTNVNGTGELLDIMQLATSLEAFVLVSTAYSNCLNEVIEERFYDPPVNPDLMVKIVEQMKGEMLTSIASRFIGKWPNSYSFTKAISENLLITKGKNMPVALFRPSIVEIKNLFFYDPNSLHTIIWMAKKPYHGHRVANIHVLKNFRISVTSSVSEPLPGWTDNLYGPLGILVSQHCGILRVLRANGHVRADTVPGDMVINALLSLAWDVYNAWIQNSISYSPPVLNFSGNNSPLYLTIRDYINMAAKSEFPPFRKAVWSPALYLVNNRFVYELMTFTLHNIPGFLMDIFMVFSGRKPRMKKAYEKLHKLSDVYYFFVTNEWIIKNDNVKALWNKMTAEDQKIFYFDVTAIDSDLYLKNLMIGLKRYILKEDMTKIQKHRERYKRLILMTRTVKTLFLLLLFYPALRRSLQWIFKLLANYKFSRQGTVQYLSKTM